MKTLTTLILAIASISAYAQEQPTWKKTLGLNYGFTLPGGNMRPYIKNGHGVIGTFLAEDPSQRIAAGLEMNYTGYGHSKSRQDYTFPDGTTAPMNIIVDNSYVSLMAMTRLYIVASGPVRPYATVKAGYTWFTTNLQIVDVNNGDSCEPVDSDVLSKDGTFVYSAGGGIRIDAAAIFKKAERGKFYIDISSNIMQGGRVNYMNEDAPDPAATHSTTRARDVNAKFINTQTQLVHEHHVGYLYNSYVQMMDFRLGLSVDIR